MSALRLRAEAYEVADRSGKGVLMHLPVSRNARLRGEVERFLADLGADCFEIASRFRRDGARGTLKSIDDCVVARYLSAVLTGDVRVMAVVVTKDGVVVRRNPRRQVRVELPEAVKSFVARFDDGFFPELLEQSTAGSCPPSPPAANDLGSGHDTQEAAEPRWSQPSSQVLPDTPT